MNGHVFSVHLTLQVSGLNVVKCTLFLLCLGVDLQKRGGGD